MCKHRHHPNPGSGFSVCQGLRQSSAQSSAQPGREFHPDAEQLQRNTQDPGASTLIFPHLFPLRRRVIVRYAALTCLSDDVSHPNSPSFGCNRCHELLKAVLSAVRWRRGDPQEPPTDWPNRQASRRHWQEVMKSEPPFARWLWHLVGFDCLGSIEFLTSFFSASHFSGTLHPHHALSVLWVGATSATVRPPSQ